MGPKRVVKKSGDSDEEDDNFEISVQMAELSNRIDKLTLIVEGLAKEKAKSTFTTPQKAEKIVFEGRVDNMDDKIVGKIMIQGYNNPHVVYEVNKDSRCYYSPEKESGDMRRRPCSVKQLKRVQKLTDEEAYALELI